MKVRTYIAFFRLNLIWKRYIAIIVSEEIFIVSNTLFQAVSFLCEREGGGGGEENPIMAFLFQISIV
jgi:hypothetical protein